MVKIEVPEDPKELPLTLIKQMSVLATSGFGLVAALAWNEVVKEFVNEVVKPVVGESSGLVSLTIYAVIVTVLAVLVTLQISRIEQRLERAKKKKEECRVENKE